MTGSHCPRCNAAHGTHGRCDRCGGPIPVHRIAVDRQIESVFDLVDRDLAAGDSFRWPCGAGASVWRITEVVDPDLDELTQRVRARRVGAASC